MKVELDVLGSPYDVFGRDGDDDDDDDGNHDVDRANVLGCRLTY